jgi:alkylhydroperoxidase/carboxymuconolactone decarboxylase family protein YurZ
VENISKEQKAKELLERITRERGFVMEWRRILCELDPDYMELYHASATYVINKRTAIPRKYKELILIALDAVTHARSVSLRAHYKNALAAGATPDEIIEAFELTTLLGIHNMSDNLEDLEKEINAFNEKKGK